MAAFAFALLAGGCAAPSAAPGTAAGAAAEASPPAAAETPQRPAPDPATETTRPAAPPAPPRAVGPHGTPTARPGVRASVRRLVTAGEAPGAAALSQDEGRGSWFGTAGVADLRSERRMLAGDRFRAGSITKTFVATVVLQLAGEGRLRLTDTVADHLPGLVRGNGNDGRRITVRQLLGHTSGLFNYTDDPALAKRLFVSGSRERPDTYTPEQLVRTALQHAPYFPPGAAYRYSNTDYILLGLVVEKVTGRPYAEEIERRILRPLGLTGTSFPGTRTSLPDPHGRAYSTLSPDASGGGASDGPDSADSADGADSAADVTRLDPSSAGAAGEAVSTLGDLNRFLRALLDGGLLRPEQLREMRDTSGSGGAYGLGLFPVRLRCGVALWGHNGTIKGSYVRVLGTPDGAHVLAYRLNTDTTPSLPAETRLLEAEFCES
ncbi:serine hydrolase domain-containing protein [Streptomyces sp. 7N604]|uniref:serine hydrolase domain-containing protein n=1 Tax=Streptomyces sp. 7N604 TaxID=3457415 RepID=UPI003FD3A27A